MKWLRYGISLAALFVALYLFWPLIGDLRSAADLFASAQWIWVIGILLMQVISYAFLTWLNLLALQPFPGQLHPLRLMALLTSMAFIETAIPSAGASGVMLRARLLDKHGRYSLEASLFSLSLETIYQIVAIVSISLFGLAYLIQTGDVTLANILYLMGFGLAAAALFYYLWHLISSPTASRRFLAGIHSYWNRFALRLAHLRFIRPLDFNRVERRLELFHHGLARLKNISQWKFYLAAYGKVFFDIASLGFCFLLFGDAVSLDTLLIGYGLILALSSLASLPGGLGVADASVAVIFARLGVPGPVALAAGLTYRLVAFWLLRFIGFISWQFLEIKE